MLIINVGALCVNWHKDKEFLTAKLVMRVNLVVKFVFIYVRAYGNCFLKM